STAGNYRQGKIFWMDESLALHVSDQDRSCPSGQAGHSEPLPLEIFDLLDVLRADEQIGRRAAESASDYEVAIGPFIPDYDGDGIYVAEAKPASRPRLEIDISDPDTNEIALNHCTGVHAFFQTDKKRQIVEII